MSTDRITEKSYLFHVTEKENIESIKKYGLKRGGMKRETFAVYFSEEYDSWLPKDRENYAVLMVDVRGLYGKMTKVDENLDEILIWGDIEPERIIEYGCGKEVERY